MNKKLILILSAVLLSVSVAVLTAVGVASSLNGKPESTPAQPSAESDGSFESESEEIVESEPEEELTVPLVNAPVFYYEGLRLGTANEGDTVSSLFDATAALLGCNYVIEGELKLVNELTSAEPIALPSLAQKLAGIVKNDYTAGCGLYINGVLSAVAENSKILESAIALFTEKQTAIAEKTVELRGLELVPGVIVKNEDLMSKNEVCALLSLCTDLKMDLPEELFFRVDRFLEGGGMPQISPVYVELKTEEVAEEIPFETVLTQDKTLYEGTKILVTEGVKGSKTLTYAVTYENGVEVGRVLTATVVTAEAVNEIYRVGALAQGSATGTLIWPTKEGYISSHYGYRYLFGETKLHGGTDIAIVTGTKLYAADGGTVTCASDKGNGYGLYVIIDHGNGMVTYYAHMSKINVKVGDKVNQGDLLGLSGATGRVTGPHLHFEVRINGERKDPILYLPKER